MSRDSYAIPRGGPLQPCTRCGVATPTATLNHLGARCEKCYEAYCADASGKGGRELERTLAPRPPQPDLLAAEPLVMPPAVPLPAPRPRSAEDEYAGLPPVALP